MRFNLNKFSAVLSFNYNMLDHVKYDIFAYGSTVAGELVGFF